MDRFVARTTEMVVEDLDGGLVIYDERSAHAHWLDPSAAAVWRACGRPSTADDIVAESVLDASQVETVLADLLDLGLVESQSSSGYSRRTVLRTAAKVGLGSAVAAPIISTVIPVAAAHASTTPGGGGGTPGGGIDLTFGYWKNNEAATTAALGATSISLGAYPVTTFQQASAIFATPDCGNDGPVACLATHLLAAKLDLAAGGPNPSCLSPVIKSADALLAQYNYSGPGTYNLSAADSATAITYETQLNNYQTTGGKSC